MSNTRNFEPEPIHRLRNHLAVIISFSELMLQDVAAGHPLHADIAEIKKAALGAMGVMPEIVAMTAKSGSGAAGG